MQQRRKLTAAQQHISASAQHHSGTAVQHHRSTVARQRTAGRGSCTHAAMLDASRAASAGPAALAAAAHAGICTNGPAARQPFGTAGHSGYGASCYEWPARHIRVRAGMGACLCVQLHCVRPLVAREPFDRISPQKMQGCATIRVVHIVHVAHDCCSREFVRVSIGHLT